MLGPMLSTNDRRRLAGYGLLHGLHDDKSIDRYCLGRPMRGTTLERIARAAQVLGITLPPSPTRGESPILANAGPSLSQDRNEDSVSNLAANQAPVDVSSSTRRTTPPAANDILNVARVLLHDVVREAVADAVAEIATAPQPALLDSAGISRELRALVRADGGQAEPWWPVTGGNWTWRRPGQLAGKERRRSWPKWRPPRRDCHKTAKIRARALARPSRNLPHAAAVIGEASCLRLRRRAGARERQRLRQRFMVRYAGEYLV
jgi:hypothetical protein